MNDNKIPLWPWEVFAALSGKGWATLLIHWVLTAALWFTGFSSAYLYETRRLTPETSGYMAWGVALFFGLWGLVILIHSVTQFRRDLETGGNLWRR